MMFFGILKVLLLLLLLLLQFKGTLAFTYTSKDGVTLNYTVRFKQTCRNEQDRVGTIQGNALPECVKECSLRPYCESVNYKRLFLTCYFYSSTLVDGNINKGNCVEIRKADIYTEQKQCENCEDEKACEPTEQMCTHKECLHSEQPQNGTILGNLNSVGDVVEIACNTGYKYMEANETKQAVCLPNGNWSMNGTDCVKDLVPYTNLAKHKQTTMSSIKKRNYGKFGVDGNTIQYFSGRSCFHTDLQQDPWWRVDLGAICEIHSVKLFNRLDSKRVARRASNMTLSVGISQQSMQQVGYVPGQIDDIHTFSFLGGIEARYVQITHLGYEYLHLCEVQVFGFLK